MSSFKTETRQTDKINSFIRITQVVLLIKIFYSNSSTSIGASSAAYRCEDGDQSWTTLSSLALIIVNGRVLDQLISVIAFV